MTLYHRVICQIIYTPSFPTTWIKTDDFKVIYLPPPRLSEPNIRDAFDMLGLRKHVVGSDRENFVKTCFGQHFQVARQGGGMAGNVNDLRRADSANERDAFRGNA